MTSSTDPSSQNNMGSTDEEEPPESSDTSASAAFAQAMRDVGPYLDLGWRLAGSAAFPPLIGVGVDLWLDTLPWGLLVGSAFGLAAAVLQLSRLQSDFK